MMMRISTTSPISKMYPETDTLETQPQSRKTTRKRFLAEADQVYDSILWRLRARHETEATMAIGFAGCGAESGSSTVASNIAELASEQIQGKILLIDADWNSKPALRALRKPENPGLYEILSGSISPREAQPVALSEQLEVLPTGRQENNVSAHVRQELAKVMIDEFRDMYSMIVVDLPPAGQLRNALPLARTLDGMLLVIRFEAVKQSEAYRVAEQLVEDGIPLWGSVLNRHHDYVPQWLRKWL